MADDSDWLPVDTSGLTDADWAAINKLRIAHEVGGRKALSKSFAELAKDPVQYVRVVGAYFPDAVREAIRDQMAEMGMTEQDVRELVRKLESPAGKQ